MLGSIVGIRQRAPMLRSLSVSPNDLRVGSRLLRAVVQTRKIELSCDTATPSRFVPVGRP